MSLLLKYVAATTFLVLLTVAHSLAQGGGKAEPRRIEFTRGTSTTTLNDKIKDDQEAEYVLAAKKGQRLTIKLTSVPQRSSVFDLKAPDNADLGLEYDANYAFDKVLPVSGDYFITVVRPTSAKGASTYKLVITIR
ncbi:MAG TPA: hypothetical protein VJ372_05675 [Pyrinomonadaceae bacterium]|jgi:hypothetical protein|nr:hypothetical protein [Pyrinomonadaceae bacterium]